MKTTLLVLLSLISAHVSWSQNKLILTNGESKVRLRVGQKVDLIHPNSNFNSTEGIIISFQDDGIVLQQNRYVLERDTISRGDFNRKLRKSGWEQYGYLKEEGSFGSCEEIIIKWSDYQTTTVSYDSILSVRCESYRPPQKLGFTMFVTGTTLFLGAPFTGIRSDRYHWGSFAASTVGGLIMGFVGFGLAEYSYSFIENFGTYTRKIK